jgi:hypothetical protein
MLIALTRERPRAKLAGEILLGGSETGEQFGGEIPSEVASAA